MVNHSLKNRDLKQHVLYLWLERVMGYGAGKVGVGTQTHTQTQATTLPES